MISYNYDISKNPDFRTITYFTKININGKQTKHNLWEARVTVFISSVSALHDLDLASYVLARDQEKLLLIFIINIHKAVLIVIIKIKT